jgi:signal transduction histidine kinase
VLVSSELLLEEVREGPILRIAQNISDGASRLSQRINELIDLARSEIGTLEINKEYFDSKPYLEEIYRSMKPVAERSGQHLAIETLEPLGTVYADKERIGQVVLNLLNNAFKFTPSGGRITLRARIEADNLIVEVEDNGRGMTEEEMKTLFKPYYKTEGDRARLSGLGLGLYLSKSFVELQGGRIWVESKRGKGSKFSFSIPWDKDE